LSCDIFETDLRLDGEFKKFRKKEKINFSVNEQRLVKEKAVITLW